MGDQQLPTWNGSPLARGPFWLMVKEQLPQEDKKLKFFLRHRALINSKSQIVVMSQEHYVIINSALDPTEYGWDDPAPADPVSRLTALAAGGNATAAANLARLTTIVAALDDEQKKNFVIGTITINEYDRELSDTICSLIKSKTDKEDWEKTKMGLELIRKQNVDSLRAAGNTANAITIQMQNMFDDGLGTSRASRWATVPAMAVLSRSSPCTFFLVTTYACTCGTSCSRLLGLLMKPTRFPHCETSSQCGN